MNIHSLISILVNEMSFKLADNYNYAFNGLFLLLCKKISLIIIW